MVATAYCAFELFGAAIFYCRVVGVMVENLGSVDSSALFAYGHYR